MIRILVPALALLFAACTPLCAVVAVSGGLGGDGGGSDWWRDGAKAPESFGVLDGNGDGKVASGEMATARQQFAVALKQTKASLMAAIDLDHSGKMSRYEAAEAMPRWTSLRDRARELAVGANDRNGDGKVAGDEARGLEERIGKVFVKYGAARVDTNQDRNMSRPEVDAAVQSIKQGKGALFALCDTSNDGQLSVREVDMAFELLAAAAGL